MAKQAKTKVVKEKSLEDILFDCRDSLRGRAPMTDKRDLLLTLVFLKFIDYRFVQQQENIRQKYASRGDEGYIAFALSRPSEYAADGVFFLQEEMRWENLKKVPTNEMAVTFDDIIKKLEDIEVGRASDGSPIRPLRNALPQQIFTKTNLEPSVMRDVINHIDMIDPARFGQTDLIGRVYEYFLQAFSINADKEEGEFYTPHSIVELIATLVEPFDGKLYDPCCGSGGMFVQSLKLLEAHGGNTKAVNVYGQESEPATYRLAKMNLAVRGMSYNLGERAVSTFTDDQHKDLKVDYIMANPPFNLKKWRTSEELLEDPRWKGYALPPESNANYAWILHMLSKLQPNKGVAGFLLSNGALDDQDALEIRRKLIENDKVEAIIVLPREMFYSTDISVTLWILNQNKAGGEHHGRLLRNRQGEVLFVDLRTWNENRYSKGKFVQFDEAQIAAITKIYFDWQTTGVLPYAQPELYYAATKEEIASKNYSLVPSRYIEFVDRDTEIDYATALQQSAGTISDLLRRQKDNAAKLENAFKLLGYEIK